MKATKQDTQAIFDAIEQNMALMERLIRETRRTIEQARRLAEIGSVDSPQSDGNDPIYHQ